MEILVADDEQLILEGLVSVIEEIVPEAKIHAFHKVSLLKEYIHKWLIFVIKCTNIKKEIVNLIIYKIMINISLFFNC